MNPQSHGEKSTIRANKKPTDLELQKARDWQFTGPISRIYLLVRFWLKIGPDPRP